MITKAIADYLEERDLGEVGKDIFVESFPKVDTGGESTSSGIYLVSTGGIGQDGYLDTLYEDISFWSVSRTTPKAYEALEGVRDVLSRATNYTTGDFLVYYSQDTSGIIGRGRTGDGLRVFEMTLRFIFRDKNVIS